MHRPLRQYVLIVSAVLTVVGGCTRPAEDHGPHYATTPRLHSVQEYHVAVHPLHNPSRLHQAEKKRFSQLLKEIEGALPSGVPEDLRSRIVGGLPFMNTPTFQERLTELLAKFETFSSLLHNVDDFVRDVKKTRNDLVHLNRQPKLMKDNFEKYVASADFLRLLTCEVILDHLGFSLDERKKIWSRNSTHLGLKARLNKPASKQETF